MYRIVRKRRGRTERGTTRLYVPAVRYMRLLAAVVVSLAVVVVIPSSGRAGDFVKIGSPVASSVNLYGVTSVFDGTPNQYEAWAVGELLDDSTMPPTPTNKGVILHFTGSYWTRVSLDHDIPPLRAVTASRFVRVNTANGSYLSPTWSTQAYAVGDEGVIMQLDPYTDSWKEMKKFKSLGRNCTDYESTYDALNCVRWTTNRLNAVVASGPTNQQPMAIGEKGTTLRLAGYWDDLGNNQGRGLKQTWATSIDPPVPVTGNASIDLTAMSFVDTDHGWIVGKDTSSGTGRAWEMTRQFGFKEIGVGAFPSPLTSVTGILRKEALNTSEPLKSIAWFGDESGDIYRYDNGDGTGAVTMAYNGTGTEAIRSIVATRRAGGTSKNIAVNSSFDSDRLEGGPNRRPDGWRVFGEYWSPMTVQKLMLPSGLVADPGDSKNPPDEGNKVLASEPWQAVWQTSALSANFRYASNSDFSWGTPDLYPQQLSIGSTIYGTFPLNLDSNDMTTSLLYGNASPYSTNFRSLFFRYAGASMIGTSIPGYLKIDDPSEGYQFRVLHPNGRVQMFIDNDDNSTNYCSNNTSKQCTLSKECTGGSCIDPGRSRLPTFVDQTVSTNAIVSWVGGTCKNLLISQCKRGGREGQLCSSDVFCQENYKVCVGGGSAGVVCADNSECVDSDGNVDGVCMKPTSGILPQCVTLGSRGCFDDADCRVGTCRGSTDTCRIDSDCALFTGASPPFTCDHLGLCVAGTIGKGCMNDINCGAGGTCDLSGKGFCQGQSNSGQTLSVADPKDQAGPMVSVRFGGDGIKSKQCVGGSADGLYCIDHSQCPGGSCSVVRSGWFPFFIRYYQENSGRCSGGNPPLSFPCTDDLACNEKGIGSCIAGKWCTGGTATNSNNGSICDDDSDCDTANGASCTAQYPPALPTDLNPNGKPGVCSSSATTPCWTDNECTTGVCRFPVSGNSPLTLQWRKEGETVWTNVPANHVMLSQTPTNTSTVVQNIPMTNIPGSTYRITGRYKVEYLDAFNSYEITDPRNPKSYAQAGVYVQCSATKDSAGDCGYDINTLTMNAASGVSGSKRCSKNATLACTNNTECADQNAGTCVNAGTCSGNATLACTNNTACTSQGAGYCRGDWVPFSLLLSKQTRDKHGVRTGVDASDTLQVVCYADVGTRVYCDDIKVTEVSSAAVTPFDTVDLFAVGDNSVFIRSTFDFSSGTPGDALTEQLPPSITPRYNSVYALDPYHVWVVGNKPINPADPMNPSDPINKERISLLSYIPGNVSGWAWVGTSQTGNDAVGWIDFNCSNLGTCMSQSSSFGVNIADPTLNGVCSGDTSQSCALGGGPDPCVVAGKGRCVAPISGSAWIGNQDTNQKMDYGPCSVNVKFEFQKGQCYDGRCGNNSARKCSMHLYTGQCMGVCALNQGFKCWKNSDCVVSCAQNPSACRSSGWMSFDRSITGDPPLPPYKTAASTSQPIATLDTSTDTIRGWARLQLGVCKASGLSCFKNSDCGGTDECSYKNAMSYQVKSNVRIAYYNCYTTIWGDQSWWKTLLQTSPLDQYVRKSDGVTPAYYEDHTSPSGYCPWEGNPVPSRPSDKFDEMLADNAVKPYDIIILQNPHLSTTVKDRDGGTKTVANLLEEYVYNGGTLIAEGELVTLDNAQRKLFAGAVMCQSYDGDATETGCNFCDQGAGESCPPGQPGNSVAVQDEPFPFDIKTGDIMSKPFTTRYQGVIGKSTSYPGAIDGDPISPKGTVDPTIIVPLGFARSATWSDIGGVASWRYGKGTVYYITMASHNNPASGNCGSELTCIRGSIANTEEFYKKTFQNVYDEVGSVAEGWVKFTGQSTAPPSGTYDYLQCKDCTAGGGGGGALGSGTCKICSRYDPAGTVATTNNACNVCTQCSVKRCTGKGNDVPKTPFGDCVNDGDCSEGTCKPFGYDSVTNAYCFDMGTNPNCIDGSKCEQCSSCSDYNVSVDYGGTKSFTGYAYSPDVGWIQFSRVRIGGKQFLQTKYGDIYSGGNIGSPTTSRAPGYPGGAGSGSVTCNATYRIIASGIIQNFCTSAPIAGTSTDPFAQQGAPLYPLPKGTNTYTTRLGSIDKTGMVTDVSTSGPPRNKFGDPIVVSNGDTLMSSFFGGPGCGKPCPTPLLGKVYHVKGNLTIDKDFVVQAGGSRVVFGVNTVDSGAGTFAVDGDLIINGNLSYDATANSLTSRTQLPSVAFIVTGDIIINPTSSELSGVFYTPQTVDVKSSEPDLQLTVSGAMVASKFNFSRKYQSASALEPSERIIYDGRLQANPPPGISTFANGLLNIQQTTQ